MTSGDIIGLATLWAQACLDAPQPPRYSEGHQIRIDQARERFVQAVAAMQAENEALRAILSRCEQAFAGLHGVKMTDRQAAVIRDASNATRAAIDAAMKEQKQ